MYVYSYCEGAYFLSLHVRGGWGSKVIIEHYHDSGLGFQAELLGSVAGSSIPRWVVVDEDIQLLGRHHKAVAEVTEKLGGYFRDILTPIVRNLFKAIEARGVGTPGIYRLSGNLRKTQELERALMSGEEVDFNRITDLHELTGALKHMLRDLTPPVLTFDLYNLCLEIGARSTDSAIIKLLEQLPSRNFRILAELVRHLKKVTKHSRDNKMTVQNLSVVFGPTIMRSPYGLQVGMLPFCP